MSPRSEDRSMSPDPQGRDCSAHGLPIVTDNVRAFVALCERGLDNRADIAGWHGTSLEAIEVAIRLGGVSASPIPHAKASAGHLFFYPPGPGDFEPAAARELRSDGRPGAQFYALGNARYHFLMREAQLDFQEPRERRRVFEAFERIEENPHGGEAARALVRLGIAPERVEGVIEELFQRRGFVVALSAAAVQRFTVSDGDVPGDDLKIYAPLGLPFDAIAGIEPLGDVEFRFFEELQAAVARHPR